MTPTMSDHEQRELDHTEGLMTEGLMRDFYELAKARGDMSAGKHDTLDKNIIYAINAGRTFFGSIVRLTGGEYRKVDRRLQALRKRGVLSFNHKTGWKVTKP